MLPRLAAHWCSVQGRGARFGAQFGTQGSIQGPGARFGARFGARGSVQGPGAQFRGQGLVQGPGAWFGAQVLSLGPEPSPMVGPAKGWLLGTEFQKCLEREKKLTTLY